MTYNYDDSSFKNTDLYKNFISENPSFGFLKVRAYMAGGAVPVSDLNVVISKNIDGAKVIFFDGVTDSSGVIESIKLPAPILDSNLDVPNRTKYDVVASYGDFKYFSIVNIFENIIVVQNINVTPTNFMGGL